ncbi:MAG: hypothetical protein WB611_11440 [Stellaceae bacterium]
MAAARYATQKERSNVDRRRIDPSLGKGNAVSAPSSGVLFGRTGDRRHERAGVDRALIHPVLWDPDSNELALAAVRKYPDRFAIMGWFYLDDPRGRDFVAH